MKNVEILERWTHAAYMIIVTLEGRSSEMRVADHDPLKLLPQKAAMEMVITALIKLAGFPAGMIALDPEMNGTDVARQSSFSGGLFLLLAAAVQAARAGALTTPFICEGSVDFEDGVWALQYHDNTLFVVACHAAQQCYVPSAPMSPEEAHEELMKEILKDVPAFAKNFHQVSRALAATPPDNSPNLHDARLQQWKEADLSRIASAGEIDYLRATLTPELIAASLTSFRKGVIETIHAGSNLERGETDHLTIARNESTSAQLEISTDPVPGSAKYAATQGRTRFIRMGEMGDAFLGELIKARIGSKQRQILAYLIIMELLSGTYKPDGLLVTRYDRERLEVRVLPGAEP